MSSPYSTGNQRERRPRFGIESLVLSLIPQEFLRTPLHSGLVFTPDHSPGFCERARDPLFSLSLLICVPLRWCLFAISFPTIRLPLHMTTDTLLHELALLNALSFDSLAVFLHPFAPPIATSTLKLSHPCAHS